MGLHGAEGENGKLQAAFDVLGIRYTGSGYLGSALAMDKGMAKKVFVTAGIPTPKGFCVTQDTVEDTFGRVVYPCVVKPCCGGSSVGVSMAENEEEYKKALAFSGGVHQRKGVFCRRD
jgi:D-alanine-D-alanine ligase